MDDYLDQVACGEETVYQSTYKQAFDQAINEQQGKPDDQDSSYRLGLRQGAKLANEICYYYGLANEILRWTPYVDSPSPSNSQDDSSPKPADKQRRRKFALSRTASDLLTLLIGPTRLMQLPVNAKDNKDLPQLRPDYHAVLDSDLEVIRVKAKQLMSLLELPPFISDPVDGESTDKLTF